MNHATWILLVYYGPVFWVEVFQFLHQSVEPFIGKTCFHPFSDVIAYGGDVVDAIAYSINVHHASSCEQGYVVILEDILF